MLAQDAINARYAVRLEIKPTHHAGEIAGSFAEIMRML
jgi:hypothetical protein